MNIRLVVFSALISCLFFPLRSDAAMGDASWYCRSTGGIYDQTNNSSGCFWPDGTNEGTVRAFECLNGVGSSCGRQPIFGDVA